MNRPDCWSSRGVKVFWFFFSKKTTFLAFLVFSSVSQAQVSTNDQAIDQLKPAAPVQHSPRVSRPPRSGEQTQAAAQAAADARRPPANPVLAPPPLVLPAHKPPPPPPVPVKADAAGAVSGIAGGSRITFGAGSADLNPATLAAIRKVAADAAANPAMTVGVTAWAPGPGDDQSTPRRLSLDRALAARAVLINAGIVSERIRTIAKGTIDIGQGRLTGSTWWKSCRRPPALRCVLPWVTLCGAPWQFGRRDGAARP